VRNGGERSSVSDMLPYAAYRANISINEGTLRLEDVTLRDIVGNSYDHGLIIINSQVQATNTLFTNIGGVAYTEGDGPIRILGPASDLRMSGCTFTANENDMVFLEPSAMMGHDTTLSQQTGLDGYVLARGFTVPPTVTLTLEPGVTVRGNLGGNNSGELRVEGHLEANGTPAQPVTFTSFHDTAPAQWPGLVFDGTAGAGTGHLRHARVRYGGIGNSVLDAISSGYHSGSNITVYNVKSGEVRLENVTLSQVYNYDGWHFFGDHGLYVNDSQVAVVSSSIENNNDNGEHDSGVYVTGDSSVLIDDSTIHSNAAPGLLVEGDTALVRVTGSSIINNQGDGVRTMGSASVILGGDAGSGNSIHTNQGLGVNHSADSGGTPATYNWWGDASGPSHSSNPGGSGEGISDRVFYDPWLEDPPEPPTVAQGLVWAAIPNRTPAGATTNVGVYLNNNETETLNGTILVLKLPWQARYLYSTGGGQFWPHRNRVLWKLGDVAPGETFAAAVQIQLVWGIPRHDILQFDTMVVASNRENPAIDYQAHLEYEEIRVVSEVDLDQSEVDAILAADSELQALLARAESDGFEYFGNARQKALSDGADQVELLLLDRANPGDMAAVRRVGDVRSIRHESSTGIAVYDLNGGSRFNYEDAEWEFWGDQAPGSSTTGLASLASELQAALQPDNDCPQMSWGECLRNCLINQIPQKMVDIGRSQVASCRQCFGCTGHGCLDICNQCARDLWEPHHNEHFRNCTQLCADSSSWNNPQCTEDREVCYAAPQDDSAIGRSEYRLTIECDDNCRYVTRPKVEYCRNGCIRGGCRDTECDDGIPKWWWSVWRRHCLTALTAKDPNAMYGPLAAAPGQTLAYQIECENVGEGTAFGVFIESKLPPELDDSTLQIGDGGAYFPGTRALVWEIGELGPKVTDTVTFTVQVPASTVSGTLVTAQATVFFPSVPETTPTNPVVTIIEDTAAHSQQIETPRGVPVAFALTGSTHSGGPLSFDLVASPLNGTLSGAPPDLTYSPVEGFVGLDFMDFTATAGSNTSRPARVSIVVKPPPTVYLPVVIR
jgi:hypothetical protein